jgi:hypothetical protein
MYTNTRSQNMPYDLSSQAQEQLIETASVVPFPDLEYRKEFLQKRTERQKNSKEALDIEACTQQTNGKILLFLGVRYQRWLEDEI